jgi:hypothetical protein
MSKRSAKDELLARIGSDIAEIHRVGEYLGADVSQPIAARMQADLSRLEVMRNYVTAAVPAVTADAPKAKRTRGKGKKAATGTASTDRPEIGDVL